MVSGVGARRVGPPEHDVARLGEAEGAALGHVDMPDGRAARHDAGAAHRADAGAAAVAGGDGARAGLDAALGEKVPGPRKVRVPPPASTTSVSPARSVIRALSGSERPAG